MRRLSRATGLGAIVGFLAFGAPSPASAEVPAEADLGVIPYDAEETVSLLLPRPRSRTGESASTIRAGGSAAACELTECDAALHCAPGSSCLLQTFPDLQWRICVRETGHLGSPRSKGLALGSVWIRLRDAEDRPWRQVLAEAQLAEVFTPYHDGDPSLRIYDTRVTSPAPVTQEDAGPDGALITLPGRSQPSVVAECRDRGPAWLCKQSVSRVRRGKELVVWGVLDAGNYDFLVEYAFLDGGSIRMRVGATGYNLPRAAEVPHMHDVLWRLDLDLNGSAGDTAYASYHWEPFFSCCPVALGPLRARDFDLPIHRETELRWDADGFTSLLVRDEETNANGHPMGYALEPLRTGTARHFGGGEDWTRRDFWVIRSPGSEPLADRPWQSPDQYLASFLGDAERLEGRDVEIWYRGSAHHHPTDEDRIDDPPGNGFGVTRVHWFGFELEPHDFFPFNPLGGPPRCGPSF